MLLVKIVKEFVTFFTDKRFLTLYNRVYNHLTIMTIELLKSKIHKVHVTQANLNYVGSITIDEDLLIAANMIENEKVQVVNQNNGERIETYIIKGEAGSGVVCLNGPAARRAEVGDEVVIISYCSMDFEDAKKFEPWLVFPDPKINKVV